MTRLTRVTLVFALAFAPIILGCSSAAPAAEGGTQQATVAQKEHSTSLEGTWYLQAGTSTGQSDLSFKAVRDDNAILEAEGISASLNMLGVPFDFTFDKTKKDGNRVTYELESSDYSLLAYATVTEAEGDSRDTILITSGYDSNVRIVGVRADSNLPSGEVKLPVEWTSFAKDRSTGKKPELQSDTGTSGNGTTNYTVTTGMKNAAKTAEAYLNTMAFSRSGLIEQLKFEGYTQAEAEYGADNVGADWKEQAARKAQEYLNTMSFSRERLIEQLEFEGFTSAQAEYGVSAVGY